MERAASPTDATDLRIATLTAVAQQVFITQDCVSKFSGCIVAQVDLELSGDDNRRVPAVLAHLQSTRERRVLQGFCRASLAPSLVRRASLDGRMVEIGWLRTR